MTDTPPLLVADTPNLVDQYCHGLVREELGLATFEARLGRGSPAQGTTFFDSRTGFAVRRWCPPLLGLDPHCPPAAYLARRRELGFLESGRRLLRAGGIAAHLVDTGTAEELTGPPELAATGGTVAREVVRLEHLAEQVADTSGTAEAFLANLSEAVHAVSATAAAFTCLGGPGEDAASAGAPPGPGAVRAAAATWLAGRAAGGRLAEPVLLAHLCWVALTTGRPLQLHARPGPRRAAALTAFAEATAGLGTDVVLLGGGGPHDHTARLAALHPHVYAGIGPVDPYGGPPVRDALAGALERAPFGKLMYASGAGGLPELLVVAAREFHQALDEVIGGKIAQGAWSARDGRRVARMIAAENARRVYGLG
ncbi:amidohydrolase [Streptomyces albidoflavus]|uniref:amidohydrolase n=1 Tax=Streptomyces albidoflavus TaxID=1886 RepID=UPI00344B1CDD